MAERADGLEAAVRALRARDRSIAEVAARLERRGVPEGERADILERLDRAGYLDDERFALERAAALAGRGAGDGVIRDDLERRGVPAELVAVAIAALEPEASRAARIVERRGWSAKTACHLAARGFGEDAVTGLVAEEE